MRYGRVMIKAGWVSGIGGGWQYQSVLVRHDGDSLTYYHGGATCRTADGWVSLPAEYHAEVAWQPEPSHAQG